MISKKIRIKNGASLTAQIVSSAYVGLAWREQGCLGLGLGGSRGVTSAIGQLVPRDQRNCSTSFGFPAVGVFQGSLGHPRSGTSSIGLGLSGSVEIESYAVAETPRRVWPVGCCTYSARPLLPSFIDHTRQSTVPFIRAATIIPNQPDTNCEGETGHLYTALIGSRKPIYYDSIPQNVGKFDNYPRRGSEYE